MGSISNLPGQAAGGHAIGFRVTFLGGLLTPLARMGVALAVLLIALSFAFPLWSMKMVAPQYPDALYFNVHAYKFSGSARPEINDIEEINTLNHYIGMAELEEQDFPELKVLPISFAGVMLLLLLAALKRSKWMLGGTLLVFGATGISGLASAYGRLYQYGHALSPDAPVKIDPFTPVMLGSNQLANFVTTGYFNVGAVLLIIAGLVLVGCLVHRPAKS